MLNFEYQNPVRIIFGKGAIAQLDSAIPGVVKRILVAYGGGSIKRNGVYDQVMAALRGHLVIEFGGIEPNPRYETLMKAVEVVRREQVDFILAVGGGSVLDGVKFIAAAARYKAGDPWEIMLDRGAQVEAAVPIGSVLTLPATGSEMNAFSVVSRESTQEKLAFSSPHVYPQFSILDPTTTMSLPSRQVGNGIVDAYAHVLEQYLTYDVNAPLQDRFAEGILLTLIEEGPKTLANPADYDARANMMWAATMALNGLIGAGVPQDWGTHMIGHELTAFYGIDHAQSLAIVFPAMLRFRSAQKRSKLIKYADRVWGLREGNEDSRIDAAIRKTEEFFRSVGVGTRLKDYGIGEGLERIPKRFTERNKKIGEQMDIGGPEVGQILELCN